VRADPAGEAQRARAYLGRRSDSYLVHFDVDVLHTGLFPLGNFPHFAGLTLDEVSVCLNEFAGGERFGGLVITEVNPDHDPSGQLLRTLAARVVERSRRSRWFLPSKRVLRVRRLVIIPRSRTVSRYGKSV